MSRFQRRRTQYRRRCRRRGGKGAAGWLGGGGQGLEGLRLTDRRQYSFGRRACRYCENESPQVRYRRCYFDPWDIVPVQQGWKPESSAARRCLVGTRDRAASGHWGQTVQNQLLRKGKTSIAIPIS